MNVKIKGRDILLNDHKLNISKAVGAYLTDLHPIYLTKLSKNCITKIRAALYKICGQWFVDTLDAFKKYRKISLTKLQKVEKSAVKLGGGKYGTVYKYDNCAIKVLEHKSYTDLPRIDGRLEAKLLSMLRDIIVFSGLSPNIVIMYQYTPDTNKDYIVLERLSKTLWTLLQTTIPEATIKNILLQIIFTLAVLYKKLPGFRHNDLKSDNVLLDETPRKSNMCLFYAKHNFILPRNVPIAKISDFDYANVPDLAGNPKVGTKHSVSFGCTSEINVIYDVHLFLNSVYSHKKRLSPAVVKWLHKQLPVSTRGTETEHVKYGRLKNPNKWCRKIKNPEKLLADKFFDEFRINKKVYPCWGM